MRLNRLMVERHDGYWQTLPLIYKFWPTWAKYSCESKLLSVVKNGFFFHLHPKPRTYFHVRFNDDSSKILSYLLCHDRESNSCQFSCTSLFEGL